MHARFLDCIYGKSDHHLVSNKCSPRQTYDHECNVSYVHLQLSAQFPAMCSAAELQAACAEHSRTHGSYICDLSVDQEGSDRISVPTPIDVPKCRDDL